MPLPAKFPKQERLSAQRRIDTLFSEGRKGYVHPLKYFWLASEKEESDAPVSVLVSVPKRSFKRAWKRNLIKRRIKESYRQRKQELISKTSGTQRRIDIAFICADSEIPDFKTIDNAVSRILEQIMARS